MAHLWMQDGEGAWGVLSLSGPELDLGRLEARVGGASGERPPGGVPGPAAPAAHLLRVPGEPAEWLLLAAPRAGLSINGLPLRVGIRVLVDRDEIRIGSRGTVFFSTESLARSEPLPSSDRPLLCPRCRQAIGPGTQAVRCPQCGLWHHQSAELPCWTYAPTCALCPQGTELDAGFRWTPEEL